MVGSDLMIVFFRGVPTVEEEGLVRMGIRAACEEDNVEVGDSKAELLR